MLKLKINSIKYIKKSSVYIKNIFIIVVPVSGGVNGVYNVGGIIINIYNKYILGK